MSGELAAAVDLGQTKILGALVDRAGNIADLQTAQTPTSDRERLVGLLESLIDGLVGRGASAVGVASCTFVSRPDGQILWPGLLPLEGFPLATRLRTRYSLPVIVENDGHAAAVAEHRRGAARDSDHVVALTVGTGVGGGLILDGRPYRGAHGLGAALGHLQLDRAGPPCIGGCPGRGHLDALASGTALDAMVTHAAHELPTGALASEIAKGAAATGSLATRLARAGDPQARALLAELGRALGAGIATLVNIFDPELVVVGGGVSEAGELLLAPARRTVRATALEPGASTVRLVAAEFGTAASLVGAGLLALNEVTGSSIGASRRDSLGRVPGRR